MANYSSSASTIAKNFASGQFLQRFFGVSIAGRLEISGLFERFLAKNGDGEKFRLMDRHHISAGETIDNPDSPIRTWICKTNFKSFDN